MLTENRITKTKDTYTAFIEKNQQLFNDIVASPFMVDTGQRYLDWLMSVLQKEKVDLTLKQIIDTLKKFASISSAMERKNIYSYNDLDDLQNAVANHLARTMRKETVNNNIEVLLNNANYLIIHPKSVESVQATIHAAFPDSIQEVMEDHLLFAVLNRKTGQKEYISVCNHGDAPYHYFVKDFSEPTDTARVEAQIMTVIRNYVSKLPEAGFFLSPKEFIIAVDKEIVAGYPKVLQHGKVQIAGSYLEDGGEMKLAYDIPFFNVMIVVAFHLFDAHTPLTLHLKDRTARVEEKDKVIKLAYEHTAFQSARFLSFLIHKDEQAPAKALRLIEFSLLEYISTPEFQEQYQPSLVYWDGEEDPHSKKRGVQAAKLLAYVAQQQEKDKPATRRDFVQKFMGYQDEHVRGYFPQLFVDLEKAGVLEKHNFGDGYTYILGPNYQAYIEGRLKKSV